MEEIGQSATKVQVGQRVVVEPALGCHVRGIEEPCRPCSQGHYANCERVTMGDIGPGLMTGICRDTGGGWGTSLVAHESQLYQVPEALPNEAAVLTEPLSCAIHGVLQAQLYEGSRVLVVGCGTIGLLTVAALKAVAPSCSVVAMGKYPYQRELAHSLGADHLVPLGAEGYQELARISGGTQYPLPLGEPAVTGGFDVTFQCVGSPRALGDSVRWTRSQGQVIMVGMPEVGKMDLAPFWYQELRLKGAYTYSWECVGERQVKTFDLALELLSKEPWAAKLPPLVMHRFPLKKYRSAIATAMHPGRYNGVKTVFDLTQPASTSSAV